MANSIAWIERMRGSGDYVIAMVKGTPLGAYFAQHGLDLDDMERRDRRVNSTTPEDVLELGKGEVIDLDGPDGAAYDRFKGAAAAIMFAVFAQEKGLISNNTMHAIIYNEGPGSNLAHLASGIGQLIYGRDPEILSAKRMELNQCADTFVQACREAAKQPDSPLCAPLIQVVIKGKGRP